jgi:hypothetical protein
MLGSISLFLMLSRLIFSRVFYGLLTINILPVAMDGGKILYMVISSSIRALMYEQTMSGFVPANMGG